MNTVLQTEHSALVLHAIEQPILDLIERCTDIADPLLEHKPTITLFGKVVHQQRNIGFFSNESIGYKYSKKLMPSQPFPEPLAELLAYINQRFNYNFNGILINKYENGKDYIGKHSDDEAGLDAVVGVVALSFGAVRTFRIRNKTSNEIVLDLPTSNNEIIQMAGDFQKEFTHEVPVEKRVTAPRYSFTFRRHLV
jgi:alkylated DNA repair dioxygenase AlkB